MTSPPETRRFRALVAYDGERFHGWQVQPGLTTVQGEIEQAIAKVTQAAVRVQGAGRTDSGVHAEGQVCSFDLATGLAPDRLHLALNGHLPPEIRVYRVEEAPPEFSARFSARWRRYRYLLARRRNPFFRGRAHVPRSWPDLARMNLASACLPGEHQFRGFTTQPEGPFGCLVHQAGWEPWGDEGLVFHIRSSRFLYQMVRILVGTFLEIGRGRLEPEAMAGILERGDRRAAGPLAPACGLYLAEVGYEPPWPAPLRGEGDGP